MTATMARNYMRRAALVEQLSGDARFRFLASTTTLQADGWAIPSEAWDLTRYRRHGPILLNHRLDSLPIGRAESVWTDSQGLWVDMVLDTDDRVAAEVARKIKAGFISGVSVNFRVKKNRGSTVTDCELIEISVVSVPEDAGVQLSARALKQQGRRSREIGRIKADIATLQATNNANAARVRTLAALALVEEMQREERSQLYRY